MNKSLAKVLTQPVLIEPYNGFRVIREDTMPGGSKMRFLPYIVDPKAELVYAGPFCGAAAICLSEIGKRTGQKITLFYAKRGELHPYQRLAKGNGATIRQIPMGFMNVLLARAREYSAKHGAFNLVPGFDLPQAQEPYVAFMRTVRKKLGGDPPQVWCSTGSGMLARCLGIAFPSSQVIGVGCGLASHHNKQDFGSNVTIIESHYKFSQVSKTLPEFQCAPNYDAKAWEMMVAKGKKGAAMWNVYTVLLSVFLLGASCLA